MFPGTTRDGATLSIMIGPNEADAEFPALSLALPLVDVVPLAVNT